MRNQEDMAIGNTDQQQERTECMLCTQNSKTRENIICRGQGNLHEEDRIRERQEHTRDHSKHIKS